MVSNLAIQDSFKELLLQTGISNLPIDEGDYFYDFLLLQILNQVWMTFVYEPFKEDLVYGLVYEIQQCHKIDRIDELSIKKSKLLKACRYIDDIEEELMKSSSTHDMVRFFLGIEVGFTRKNLTQLL